MVGWLIGLSASVTAAYLLGRRQGIRDANRAAILPGAWVEVVKTLSYRGGPGPGKLPAGTQALVTNVDRWGRIALWIADPWASEWGSVPQVFGVRSLTALRARPIHAVNDQTREATLAALRVWQGKVSEMEAAVFPPGFLEIQRLLNQ